MQIEQMSATFGRLNGSQLDLQPGLNVICAPNESGKSTWCRFLQNMLYGVPTKERGLLADKNRYAPWSGSPMQGRLLLRNGDARYTLLRETRRTSAPMGDAHLTYTGTADPVPGILAAEAGQYLLGIPREVFLRSAFIGQNALAVDQDAELERRIAALISTGEEDTSYSESYERLKKQLNARRANRSTGQIPALEQEIAQLEDALARQESLREQLDTAQMPNTSWRNCSSRTPSGSSWSAKPPVTNTRRPKQPYPPPSSSIGNWSSAATSYRTRRHSPSWRDKLPL